MNDAFISADIEALCRAQVEAADLDRAVSVLFAPSEHRAALLALYAFDIETASVRDRISQPMPGEIRLQWWRDTIASRTDGGGSPLAEALAKTIRAYDLPLDAFERLLEARIFDLYDDPMPSRTAFEAYAGETASTIIMLAAMVLDREAARSIADIAGHAGVAQTVAQAAAKTDRLRARSQIFVPADILAATGVSFGDWLSGTPGASGADLAFRAFGQEHYGHVEANFGAVPASCRPALLPALLVPARLAQLGEDQAISPLTRSWVFWRGMRGRAPKRRRTAG